MKNDLKKISKFLSFILRHKPESIGLTLDDNGWANIQELIKLANRQGKNLKRDLIEDVVASNDKQRFSISDNGIYIRANQGHSIEIDLQLQAVSPPEFLFHGTATRFLDSIFENGIQPSGRHHVHLSTTVETATSVGKRHGKPVILKIAALTMAKDGYEFFQSDNKIWLTGHVPPDYFHVEK